MNKDAWIIIIVLIFYFTIAYLIYKFVSGRLLKKKKIARLILLSLLKALLFGIGIAATGGDPGFGFPAPNGIALYIMAELGNTKGFITGLKILGFWWVIIFIGMLFDGLLKLKASSKPQHGSN